MNILWFGDSADTGFGTVTRNIGLRLLGLGHDFRNISMNLSGEPIPEPLGSRTWDIERIGEQVPSIVVNGFSDGWKADVVFVLGDYEAVRTTWSMPVLKKAATMVPTYHYCPVEGVDLPPSWKALWDFVHPIAMSEFGADQIEKVTGLRPPMIYHGVSTDEFYPVAPNRPGKFGEMTVTTKDGAKRALNRPEDRILILRTDRHMPRKRYNSLLRAMPAVFSAVPNLDLVIHCRAHDQGGRLGDSISKLPREHQGRIFMTGAHNTFAGLARASLNVLYNAADIYVSTSAEGFGLTIAEAIACGVPAVALDYSAVPEVVGPAGVLVPATHLIDNEYDHCWAAIDEERLAEELIRLARKPSLRRELGSQGPRHVASKFSWAEAATKFATVAEQRLEAVA